MVLILAGALPACATGTGGDPAPAPTEAEATPSPRTAQEAEAPEPDVADREQARTAMAERAAGGVLLDTVRAGRFDNGKMWTFEYPPVDYLDQRYGFRPDSSWFREARLGALRIPGCSASFVSAHGLVMTNHHCARESVTQVSREGESLLDDGFYSRSLEEERPIEDFHADQLVEIRDVTDQVYAELEGVPEQERSGRRQEILGDLESEILQEFGGEDGGHVVEMISLYNGGRYSAYVFRRYQDVRLVTAPELQIGFYGGDPDNFTYPRYNLDFAFLRVYGDDGEPLDVETYFGWGADVGAEPEDLVFVIGNPGSTSRLQTVAQLEFRRDVSDQYLLDFLGTRIEALRDFMESNPEVAEEIDLRNTVFSLANSEKAYTGMVRGLNDPVIMARRLDTQQSFQDSILADPQLRSEYGDLIDRMARLQTQKREHAPAYGVFLAMTSPDLASTTLQRALFAQQIVAAREQGVPEARLQSMKDRYLGVGEQPAELDEVLMEARFEDVVRLYGRDSDVATNLLAGRTPGGLAAVIADQSALTDSAGAARVLESREELRDDPAVRAVGAYFPVFMQFQQMLGQVSPQEEEIAAQLGRARFEVYGTDVPPDATFSLRLADGVVQGYEYNGTRAPYQTTFYGLWDHFYSYAVEGPDSPWYLPERWQEVPSGLDLATPLNFVSTNDIIGGNSGSPVVNRDLEVVGLVFDGNIESLPGDYIYLPEIARAVSVDVRGIQEALDDAYDMDRIVLELTRGQLAETEAEADQVLEGR